jgi:hypothetical protein
VKPYPTVLITGGTSRLEQLAGLYRHAAVEVVDANLVLFLGISVIRYLIHHVAVDGMDLYTYGG